MQLLFTGMSLFFLFFHYPEGSMKLRYRVLFFSISAFWLIYTLRAKQKERDLIRIKTNATLKENVDIIRKLIEHKKLQIKTENGNYFELMVPFLFSQKGHKLTLIAADNYIFFNLRNIGSSKGRSPYLFGIDTFKSKKILKEIKRLAKQVC